MNHHTVADGRPNTQYEQLSLCLHFQAVSSTSALYHSIMGCMSITCELKNIQNPHYSPSMYGYMMRWKDLLLIHAASTVAAGVFLRIKFVPLGTIHAPLDAYGSKK